MTSRRNKLKALKRHKECFALIPEKVLQSDAWHWLPHFARSVVVMAAGLTLGYRNGMLELTPSGTEGFNGAKSFGISKNELYAGLRLACEAGLLDQTSKGKHRSGKGIPASYAVSWDSIEKEQPYKNIFPRAATNAWKKKPSGPRIKSVAAAERYLGWRKPSTTGGEFLEGVRTVKDETAPPNP